MEIFKHYDVKVMIQDNGEAFEKWLKETGVEYTYLPILEDKVLMYTEQEGIQKYAYIPRDHWHIFTTTEIPLDLNWKNIERDYRDQKKGEEPMRLPTRASLLMARADELSREDGERAGELVDFCWEPPADILNSSLMQLGTNLLEIDEMDHHDISQKYLDEKIKELKESGMPMRQNRQLTWL